MQHLPRGTVTLLFTDIEGSTRMLQQLGDGNDVVRLMSAGPGWQVHGAETARDLVEQDLSESASLRDLAKHRLTDLGRPQRLFQLVISGLPADFPPLKTLDTHPNTLPIQF